jgi:hypothetical protein
VTVDLADAQRDEGNAEAPGQHAHLRDLEVLREVRYEAVLGGGARDIEGEEGPETVVGAAGPHELLAQRQRAMSIPSSSAAAAASLLRSGGLRLFVVGVGEGRMGFLSARRFTHREEGILGFAGICGGDRIGGGGTETGQEGRGW